MEWHSLHSFVLFCHLLAAFLFIAGIVVAGTLFEVARRSDSPRDIAVLLRVTRVGVVLVAFGGLMVPFFGLWLVHLDGFDYGARWISGALGLYVLAMALGGLGGQHPKRARLLAGELAERGEGVSAELRALLDARLSRLANYASGLLILVILVLMVYKPS